MSKLDVSERFWMKVDKHGPIHGVLGTPCWLWLASTVQGYGQFAVSHSVIVRAHRFAWEQLVGPVESGLELDHRCHNLRCVNVGHLRAISHKGNGEHRLGAQRNNGTSGIRGVYPDGRRWRAQIRHNGVIISLGSFASLDEAVEARLMGEDRYFTHHDLTK